MIYQSPCPFRYSIYLCGLASSFCKVYVGVSCTFTHLTASTQFSNHSSKHNTQQPHQLLQSISKARVTQNRHPSIGGASRQGIITSMEAGVFAAITLLLPSIMYIAVHQPILFDSRIHLWSLLLLFNGPLLLLMSLKHGLWWTGLSTEVQMMLRFVVGLVGLVGLVLGIEGRVVFYSFGQYIKLPPGWDWLFVSVSLFGLAILVYGHMAGRR